MKKTIAIILTLVLALSLAACGGKADDKTITVAASPTPHAEILKVAAEVLAKDGWTLEINLQRIRLAYRVVGLDEQDL